MDTITIVGLFGGWLLSALIGVYLFGRFGDTDEKTEPSPTTTPSQSTDSINGAGCVSQSVDEEPGGTVACPFCGTENDCEYTFCRQCVGDLSPGRYGWKDSG